MSAPQELEKDLAAVFSALAYKCSDDGTGMISRERVTAELAKSISEYPVPIARELTKWEVGPFANQDMVEFRNKHTGDITIAIRGTDLDPPNPNSFRPFSDLWAIRNMSEANRMVYAVNRIAEIRTETPNINIAVTGHSLGGRIGIEIGKIHPDTRVIVFNAAQPFKGKDYNNTYPNIFSFRTQNDFCNPLENKGAGSVTYVDGKPGVDSHSINNFTPSKIDNHHQRNLGGIDMSLSDLKDVSISSVLLSNISNTLNLITADATNNTASGVKLGDLATALKVFYHSQDLMDISFSLDPKDVTNPSGPWQQKIFYPDEHFTKKILEGTEFGEALFEADWLMKQISMGVSVNSIEHPVQLSKIVLPNELISQGLAAHHNLSTNIEPNTWYRFWIVVENIEIFENVDQNGNCVIEFGEVKMGVKARVMSIDPLTKTLVDDQTQNLTSSCYQFAQKFSQCYDTCCKYYPEFVRLKQIVKAVSLAKLMRNRCIPIDMHVIDQLYEKSKIANFQKDVPQLFYQHENNNCRIKVSGGVNLNVDPKTMIGNKRQLTCLSLNENQLINSRIINQSHLVCSVTGRALKLDEALFYFKDGHEQVYSRETHPGICNECNQFIDVGQPFIILPKNEFFFNISPTFHKNCFKCSYSKEPITDKYVTFAGGYFLPKYINIVKTEMEENQEHYNNILQYQQPTQMNTKTNVKKSIDWICEFCANTNPSTYCICELCFQARNYEHTTHSNDTWHCEFCTFTNPSSNSNCAACYQTRNPDHITHSQNTWNCEFCTFLNSSNNSNCAACYQSKTI